MPDRIIIGHGLTIFVELKAPSEKPRKLQDVVIQEMREHGAIVHILDTKQKTDVFFEDIKSSYLF